MNTAARELQAQGVEHIVLHAEPGHYLYTENNWLYGLKSFEMNGYGAKLQNITTNGNSRVFISLHSGSMWETTDGAIVNSAVYRDGALFESVAAGSTEITLQDPLEATDFSVGARVILYGRAQQKGGFPPNCRYVEYQTVAAVGEGTGVLTFEEHLLYSYDQDWLEKNSAVDPAEPVHFGPPRVLSLDRPDYVWPELIILRGIELLINPNKTVDGWSIHARKMVLEDLTCRSVYPQQTENFEAIRCTFGGATADKIIGKVRYTSCDFLGGFGDAVSADSMIVDDCRFLMNGVGQKQIRQNARNFVCKNSVFYANEDAVFGIFAYRGFSTYYLELSNNVFYNNAADLESVINNLPVTTFTIEAVDGDDLLFTNNSANFDKFHLVIGNGCVMWRTDGAKSGVFEDVILNPDGRLRVKAQWSAAPEVNEDWAFHPVQDELLVGNRIAGRPASRVVRFPLYAKLGRANNVLLTAKDLQLVFSQAISFSVKGFLREICIAVNQLGAATELKLTIGSSVSTIDLASIGIRKIGSLVSPPLGSDVLDNGWINLFTEDIKLDVDGPAGFGGPLPITVACHVDPFGL